MAAPPIQPLAPQKPAEPPLRVPSATTAPMDPKAPSRLGWHLEGLLAHLPLAVLFTWPLVLNLGGNGLAPGVMTEDRAQNLWNLWWVKTALLDLHTNPFSTDYIWYPTPVSLYYHTLNPFNGLLSIPFQGFMSLPAILSGIVLFSFIVAGWGAYLLVYYVLQRTLPSTPPTWRQVGALVGSAAFTYSAYHIATQRGQLQLVSLEWAPFYVLFVLRAIHDWPPLRSLRAVGGWLLRAALPAAVFLLLVALVDWYYVMYMVLFTLLYGLYLAGRAWVRGDRSRATLFAAGEPVIRLAAVGGLFLLLTSWWLAPMVAEARSASYMRPVPGIAFINSADLLTFFLPPLDQHWWGTLSRFRWDWPVGVQRYEVYFGYVALALAALGLLAWRSRVASPFGGARENAALIGRDGTVVETSSHPGPHPARGERETVTPLSLKGRGGGGEGRGWPLPGRGFWLGVGVIFFTLALGPTLQIGGVPVPAVPMPYAIIEQLPGFNISRSPDRFDMPLTLCLGVLVGYGAMALAARLGRWPAIATAGGLVGLMFIELWPVPYPQLPAPIYSYYEQVLDHDPGDYAIVELPPQDDYWHGAFAMYYQTAHHKRILGGYLSREFAHPFMENTAGFRDLHAGSAPGDMFVDSLDAGLTALAQYNVRQVILYKTNIARPTKPFPPDLPAYHALLAAVLGPQAGSHPIYTDDQLEAYAVPPPTQIAPYLVLGSGWYRVEPPDQHRWVRGTATLQVVSPVAFTGTLAVEAQSFHRPRTLEVRVDGQLVQSIAIGPAPAPYRLGPLPLRAGTSTISFSTTDPGESPQSLGVSDDARELTFMFRQVRIEQ